MTKTFPATLALVSLFALAGCHVEHTSKEVAIVITPNFSASTANVDCVASTTDKCRLLFMSPTGTSELMVHKGASGTATGISQDARFCLDVHKIDPAACSKQPMPSERATIKFTVTNSSKDSD